jgi:serine/threonine-protein kinase
MALAPGTRIGEYEVLTKLGEGGMGEVYRARDTRLGRDVALKFVSDAFVRDPDRLSRFEREARSLASLNHPSIATIHGVHDADGRRALVMEFVDGEDLSARIARGPMPLDEALPVARQIADALEAAHDSGVIHRDLKPANIKLRPDGTVKVLDFGLAKAIEGSSGSGSSDRHDLMNSPTITSPAMTAAGVILGTAAYMSPEQAKGLPIDRRADIWAFGCVLYEMLTGKRAFDGDDVTDTLVALISKEPDWSRLPASTPAPIRRLLRRCLAKPVKERLQSIGDAKLDIAEAAAGVHDDPSPVSVGSRQPAHGVSSWGVPWRGVAVSATATLVLGAAIGWMIGRTHNNARVAAAPSPMRLSLVPPDAEAITVSGNDRDLAISPNGKLIAYVGGNGTAIIVRDLARKQAVRIDRAGLPHNPFFSSDGNWVGFTDGLSTIKKVPATGGPIELVCHVMAPGIWAAWSGDTVVFAQAGLLYRVPASGGQPVVVTKRDTEHAAVYSPTFLPDGHSVLVGFGPTQTSEGGVGIVDLRTGTQKLVLPLGRTPGPLNGLTARFVAPGYLVYRAALAPGPQSAAGLRAVKFDPQRMETLGPPIVVDEPIYTTDFGGFSDFDIAQNGTLVYVSTAAQPNVRRPVWVHRDGREDPIELEPRAYTYPNLSPDGKQVAFDIRDQENDIWIWEIQSNAFRRLTFDPGFNQYGVWTHDQRHVAHALDGAIRWQAPDGSGQIEVLAKQRNLLALYAFSRDDRQLIFREDFPETGHDLMVLSIADRTIRPLLQSRSNELNADLSPDGRWLAYESDESGTPSVDVRPFPDINAGHWQVSTGGRAPRWSGDGKELYFLALDGAMMVARVEPSAAFVSHPPAVLFEHHNFVGAASSIGRTYDVSPDGSRFLMFKPAPPTHISVVLNWTQTLADRSN